MYTIRPVHALSRTEFHTDKDMAANANRVMARLEMERMQDNIDSGGLPIRLYLCRDGRIVEAAYCNPELRC